MQNATQQGTSFPKNLHLRGGQARERGSTRHRGATRAAGTSASAGGQAQPRAGARRAETARASGCASLGTAVPGPCCFATRATPVGPAGGGRRHNAAASDKAHGRGAVPRVLPDVPPRCPAAAWAHWSTRQAATTAWTLGQRSISGMAQRHMFLGIRRWRSWSKRPTYRERAGQSRPQAKACWCVSKRLRASPLQCVTGSPTPHTTGGC